MLLVAAVALASGCGGSSPDYAPNFLGIWTGDLTVTDTSSRDVVSTGTAEAYFAYLAPNTVKFDNACDYPDTGPTVFVTSATELSGTLVSHCISVSSPDCASIVQTWTSLSGSLNGPVLSFTGLATLSGCGLSANLSFAFTNGVGGGTPSETPSRF